MREFINIIEILTEARMYFGGFARQPSRDEVIRYMRGWCPYFALALHDVYGWQIVTSGEHIATKTPTGQYVDIRGVMTPEEFSSEIEGSPEPISREELVRDIETGMFACGFYEETQLKRATRIAKAVKPILNEGAIIENAEPVNWFEQGTPVRISQTEAAHYLEDDEFDMDWRLCLVPADAVEANLLDPEESDARMADINTWAGENLLDRLKEEPPILLMRTMRLLDGNHRTRVAQESGLEFIPMLVGKDYA